MRALQWMIGLGLASALTSASAQPWLEKDLSDFKALWNGQWSNDRQNFFAEGAGLEEAALSPLQEIVLASEDDGSDVQWALQTDGEVSSSVGVQNGTVLQTFTGLSKPCRVTWRRQGSQFAGQGEGRGCAELLQHPDQDQLQDLSLSLSPSEMWLSFERRRGSAVDVQFRKARPFTCWVAVMRGAEHGDSGEGMSDWDFRRGVAIHDQGGVAMITTDEEPSRSVRLRLRDVDWPYGNRRPSLTLYVLGDESDRAVSYSWTEGSADRIGLNLRWLQASCTADEA